MSYLRPLSQAVSKSKTYTGMDTRLSIPQTFFPLAMYIYILDLPNSLLKPTSDKLNAARQRPSVVLEYSLSDKRSALIVVLPDLSFQLERRTIFASEISIIGGFPTKAAYAPNKPGG